MRRYSRAVTSRMRLTAVSPACGTGQVQEHVVQGRAMRFEVSERESLFDTGLKQISRLAARLQDDLPVRPAVLCRRELLGARYARQTRRIAFRAQADAARQHRLGLFLIAVENFLAACQHDQTRAEPFGVLHHVRREQDGRSAARRRPESHPVAPSGSPDRGRRTARRAKAASAN